MIVIGNLIKLDVVFNGDMLRVNGGYNLHLIKELDGRVETWKHIKRRVSGRRKEHALSVVLWKHKVELDVCVFENVI